MITELQEHFMQMTVELAQCSVNEANTGPFGAIIVKDDNIIGSSGCVVFKDTDPCAHAERMAIRDACKNLKTSDLSGCQLYSVTEPCPMCLAAIYWAQINAIYYLDSNGQINEYGADTFLQSVKSPALEYIPDQKALHVHPGYLSKRPNRVAFS
jgi:tRNA(Arg) A34 adenosine deaminase TadA